MSEKKERGPKASYKVNDRGDLIIRRNDRADELIDLSTMSAEMVSRAVVEAVINYLSRGFPVADVVSGAAFPDRRVGVAKAPKVAKTPKLKPWDEAIVEVLLQDHAPRRGEKLTAADRAEFRPSAIAQLRAMTPAAIAQAKEMPRVQLIHAEQRIRHLRAEVALTDSPHTLDNLLTTTPAPPRAPIEVRDDGVEAAAD